MFQDIIGQDLPKKILTNAIKNKKINHAYIFYGKDGTGKMTLAKKFSQYLICKNGSACMECSSCKQFISNTSDDFKIIDILPDKSEILVDQIREAVNDVYIKPHLFPKKIYIINNADKMNIRAQNAFLKVFEEPPEYAVFILIAQNTAGILPTILSRGCEVRFSPLGIENLKKAVKVFYNADLPDDIAIMADGSISTAMSLINSDGTSKIREAVINGFCNFLKSGSYSDMLSLYKHICDNKESADMIFNIFYSILTDIVNKGNSDLIKIADNNITLSDKKIYSIFEILEEASMRIKTNASFPLMILDMLLKIKKEI